jgi:hypothetical protein
VGPTQPFVHGVTASFLGLKRPGRGVDHFHKVPRLRMTGAVPLPFLSVFLARTVTDLPYVCKSPPPENVYVFRFYPIRATCPACFILFGCFLFISQSSAATSHCQLPIAVRPLTYARSGESSANRELLVVQLSSLLQLLHSEAQLFSSAPCF